MNGSRLLLVSAMDAAALKRRAEDAAAHLERHPTSLPDVAYTLAVGRKRFPLRAAITLPAEGSPADVLRAMEREYTERTQAGPSTPPRVAFMFPGQGSQFVGMGRDLFERDAGFRDRFRRCDAFLADRLGLRLETLLFAGDGSAQDTDTLTQTRIAQPALFVVEYCLAHWLMEAGVKPDALVGHSVGELVAACLAGVFELEAALTLVAERGRLMQSLPPGAMAAVRCAPEGLAALLGDDVTLAAHNAPELCVVSGTFEAMQRFTAAAEAAGLETRGLHTSHAFHSPMMDPILEPFRRAVESARPQPPRLPILSTLTGAPMTSADATSPDYWARQLRQAVRFSDASKALFDAPERVLIEVGPGTALTTSAAKHTDGTRPRAMLETLGGPKDPRPAQDALLRCLGRLWLQGAELDWQVLHRGAERTLLRLPTYPFTRQVHWVQPPTAAGEDGSRGSRGIHIVGAAPDQADGGEARGTQDRVYALLAARLGRRLDAADRERSFVELGFDSLALSQLRARIDEQFGVAVTMRQLFEGQDTPQLLAEYIEGHVPAAIAAVAAGTPGGAVAGAVSEAGAAEPERRGMTTEPQRELWVACAAGGDVASLCYNECRRIDLRGKLDVALLESALQRLLQRHESLRQVFSADGSEFIVRPYQAQPLRRTDLGGLDGAALGVQLETLCRDEVATPFDLERGPLYRTHLLRCSDTHHVLLLCAHHIAADGSSIFLMLRELAEIYSALVEGRAVSLPAADSYLAYAERQAKRVQSGAAAVDEKFWLQHLSGHTDDLDLPTDRARPALRSFPAARQDFYLDATTTEALRGVGRRAKTTLQTVLMATVQLLLQRVTRQTDVVIGMPASGQAAVGANALTGHCVHVLPIRQYLDTTKPFVAYLNDVRHTLLDCLEHQEITFTSYLEKLGRPRDPSRIPLVPFGFGMGRTPKVLPLTGVAAQVSTVHRLYEAFEIYLFATEDGEGVNLAWSYNTDLFDEETIRLWQRCLQAIVAAVVADGGATRLDAMNVLSEEDRNALLRHALGPQTPVSDYVGAQERFRRFAERTPDAVALVASDTTLTYAALHRRANQLGQWLSRRGMAPGTLVAVCLERTSHLVWSMLGVWRAGLAYVPLDPKYPKARVQMILEDSGTRVLLTTRSVAEEIIDADGGGGVEVVLIEDLLAQLDTEPDTVPQVQRDPADCAYVIFTSGSTGRPKGVQICQRAFDNFLVAMAKAPGITAQDRVLALTTVSFDIAGLELFLPLTHGASLVLATADQATDPAALVKLVEDNQVTLMQATPATWQMLLDGGWQGSARIKVLCGGEAFPRKLAETLVATCGEVWNVYGPTETTVWSSVKHVDRAADLAIGRPIDNTTMYVLDEQMGLAPTGSGGELWIGGRGVADGYLGRPDLTADRFKPNPFLDGDVIYRTGDLARIRRDGQFECLGRLDFQVKIRGFRIELGEIETAIVKQPGVAAAVVVAREDTPGNKILVAYVVPAEGVVIDTVALRQQLLGLLPAYMVPGAYMLLGALPMTPNNKVDRKALPAPDLSGEAPYAPPDLVAADGGVTAWIRVWSDAPAGHDPLPPSNWLLLADDSSLSASLRARLEKAGHAVTVVHARDRYHEAGEGAFTINPEVGQSHFDELFTRLAALGRLPDRVVHLWLAGSDADVRLGSSLYHHHQERGLYTLLYSSRLLAKLAPERAVTFHVVTSALHHAGVSVDDRGKAALLGACQVIGNEFVNQKVAVMELPAAIRADREKLGEMVAADLLCGPTEALVAYRDQRRQQHAWSPLAVDGGQASLPAGALVVVGLSRAGLTAARLAAAAGVKVAYVHAADDQPSEAALRTELASLEQGGLVAASRGVDLANGNVLRAALQELAQRVGAFAGVFVALPEPRPALVQDAREEQIEACLAPAMQLLLLLDEWPAGQLKRLWVCNTVHAALGGPGALAESAANAVFALEGQRRGAETVIAALGPVAGEPAELGTDHVGRDRAHFREHGLGGPQLEAAVGRLLRLAPGDYVLCRYDVDAYRTRLELSAARDAGARAGRRFVEPKNATERRLAELWAEVLRLDRVSTEDSFFDLGGHSLLAVRLFAKINKEFGVALPLAALFESPTIAKFAARLSGDTPEAAAGDGAQGTELLVKLHAGTDPHRAPLFVVHGAFGNVLNLRHLARLADPRRDFYAIQARGLDGKAPPHQSLVEAAEAYVEQVRRLRPHGPYLLGGFCVGGVVAVEMARLLKAQGEQPGAVVLLDSHVPGYRGTLSARDRLQIHKERLQDEGLDYVRFWAQHKYEYESERLRARLGLNRKPVDPTQYQSDVVHEAIEAGMRAYEPKPYDGEAVLFRPPLAPKHRLAGGREVNVRRVFLLADNGWRRVVRALKVEELAAPPGDHDGFVLEPYVRDLARRLRQLLDSADPERG